MLRRTLAFVLLSGAAFGCSIGSTPRKVSRVFSVRVSNDFGPVAGLKLKVYRFDSDAYMALPHEQQESAARSKFETVIARAETNANGIADFVLDRTGGFSLTVDGTVSGWSWAELDVSDEHREATVELIWPATALGGAILEVAHLRGRLTKDLRSSRSAPVANTALILHRALDYTPIATTRTGDDGSFKFSDVAPGLYFVQILPSSESNNQWELKGDIALRVSNGSRRESVAVSTEYTSCGLGYDLEENKPKYRPSGCVKGGKVVPCDY